LYKVEVILGGKEDSDSDDVIYVMQDFIGHRFDSLRALGKRILGVTAIATSASIGNVRKFLYYALFLGFSLTECFLGSSLLYMFTGFFSVAAAVSPRRSTAVLLVDAACCRCVYGAASATATQYGGSGAFHGWQCARDHHEGHDSFGCSFVAVDQIPGKHNDGILL
jgi:hypothetical protein